MEENGKVESPMEIFKEHCGNSKHPVEIGRDSIENSQKLHDARGDVLF